VILALHKAEKGSLLALFDLKRLDTLALQTVYAGFIDLSSVFQHTQFTLQAIA
jgi:hypothetical protein